MIHLNLHSCISAHESELSMKDSSELKLSHCYPVTLGRRLCFNVWLEVIDLIKEINLVSNLITQHSIHMHLFGVNHIN